jgi:hypothetical protein
LSDPTIDLRAFTGLRRKIDTADAKVRRAEVELASARDELDQLARSGASPGRITTAESRVARLSAEHAARLAELNARIGDLSVLATDAVGRRDPAGFVKSLNGRFPVALLPVRIETRFFEGGNELRIRIYPDQLHLDAHEPELTDAEFQAGERYWRARWRAGEEASRAAWEELAGTIEPRRASWVAIQTTPTNLHEQPPPDSPAFPTPTRKSEAWVRPVQATALPDRWVAVGFKGEEEIFRRWGRHIPDTLAAAPTPSPTEDPTEEAEVPPDQPPGDDPMRWAIDYQSAVAVGMGITITGDHLPAGRSLRNGIDRLLVLGVDWTLTPEQAGDSLSRLLEHHRFSDGFEFVSAGVATNNTSSARSGASSARQHMVDQLYPDDHAGAQPSGAGGRRLAVALGLQTDQFDSVPGSELSDSETEGLLADVLWAATLGHYLDDLLAPLVAKDVAGLTRDHVVRWLKPGGPLPTLRIGRQPYGILPVVARDRFVPDRSGGFESNLSVLLNRLRTVWVEATGRVPRMGRSGDIDADLVELLQRNPLAMVARFRKVFGPASVADTKGFAEDARAQSWLWALWRMYLGWSSVPELSLYTTDPADHPLPVPWVQAGELGSGPLEPNYLTAISSVTRSRGGRDRLASMTDAGTLLEALVAHAAAEELDGSFMGLIVDHIGRQPELNVTARALRTQEMYGVVETPTATTASSLERQSVTLVTPGQTGKVVVPDITGARTVEGFISDLITTQPERPEVRTLASFLESLDELSSRPASEIDRAFRGLLDCMSHRLDAWSTSLATRHLDSIRKARSVGIHLGGYGWVENLRPDRQPDSLGFIHAPSIPQATAAAILRSGHLSHRGADHETLDLQLTSDRVQRAMPVIHGVAAGQPLAALIGYRLERSLRESDDRLARYILPARRFAPFRPSSTPVGPGPVEAIGARDVVDGVNLLQKWRDDRGAVLDGVGVLGPDQSAVSAVLDDVAMTYDAVSDTLVTESVYQTVLGNFERAGAALAAVDKQQPPPDPDAVRTPRTGITYTQKVMVGIGPEPARTPWRAAFGDARSAAAPALNAWVASLLPDPDSIVFWGVLMSPGVEGSPDSIDSMSATATELGISPLSLVLATASASGDQPSELESRVVSLLVSDMTLDDGDRLELLDGRPEDADPVTGDEINLGAVRALLTWIRELLGNASPLTAEDLALPGGDRQSGVDLAHLEDAAHTATQALVTARLEVSVAIDDEDATAASLRAALRAAADLGVVEAVPGAATGGSAAVRRALCSQLPSVQEELARRSSRLEDLGDGPQADSTDPVPEPAVIEYHRSRLQAVFGEAFPVVPAVDLPAVMDVAEFEGSLGDQGALTSGDDLKARIWLDRMALVRPGVDRLARILQASEALASAENSPPSVRVAQLPHVPGQLWLALPFGEETPAGAQVAVALHEAAGMEPRARLVGLVVDEWVETIPSDAETTAVTFHYDAPGARAPQSVLLAVPPRLAMDTWDLDVLIDTVLEAAELTRIRGVAPKDLRWVGGGLPIVYLPQNFTGDRPSVDLGSLLAKFAPEIVNAEVLGKGWSL